MANEINIGINTTSDLSGLNQVDESVKSLRTQLKEAQANVAALSEKFGATSQQAIEAAKNAAILKDKIGDAKSLTDSFNPDAKFKALSGSLTGVAGGFSAVTGALGLMGKESKDVEKAILKVQSAMAFAGGVQALGESIDSFKQLGAVIKSTTIFQRAATAAQWLWNAALSANPIGAVILAISGLITAGYLLINMFKASKPTIDQAAESLKKHTEATKKNNEEIKKAIEKKREDEEYQYRLMKAQGLGEITILKTAVANAKATQSIANKNYQTAHEIALAEYLEIVERKKLAARLQAELQETKNQGGWTLNVERRIEENEKELKSIENKYKIDNEVNKLRVEDVKNANAQLLAAERNLNVGIAQEKTDANQKEIEEQKRKNKEAQEERERIAQKNKESELQRVEESKNLVKEEIKTTEDLLADSEVKKENLRHQRQLKEINEKTVQKDKKKALEIEEYNHTKLLGEAELKDKQALQDKFDKLTEDEYNKSVEFMEIQDAGYEDNLKKELEHYEHLKTIQQDYGKSTIDIDKQIAATKKEIAKEEEAIELAKLEMRREVTNKTIDVAGQAGQLLQDIAGKSKGIAIGGIIVEKAASIAGIIASTQQANAQFLANPASAATLGAAAISPIALNNISAGIGIASIIAQSAKSISEINGAKSSDAVGGGSEPAPSKFATGGLVTGMGTSTSDSIMARLSNGESVINAKSTAMFGNLLSNINQAGGGVAFGNQNNANPIFKTYVVASEMTSQIEANLKLKQIASL